VVAAPSSSRKGGLALGAHEQLRIRTRTLHQSLETRLDLPSLADRAGYVRYLMMNWPCASIEPALSEAGIHRFLPDWSRRQRRFALADDLRALNICPSAPPRCEIAADGGTVLGWSYVLEGSRLGARIILKAVEESEDLAIRHATRFLRHGDGCGFWMSLKAALTKLDNDPGAIENACKSPCSAFECFGTSRASS
jgi:heme oxygenase (biliverdin-IX-beta and delta-forming)